MRFALRLFVLLTMAGAAFGQQRPLITELPEPVEEGKVRLEAGVDFLQNQTFPLSGLRGDLTRIGVIGARFGLGSRIEFQIHGTARNFLNINRRGSGPFAAILDAAGNSTSATGDFLFATKIRLREESGSWPAFSFRIGAELPNQSNESGLGIDTTRTFGSVLVGKHLGKTHVFSSLGVAIIDNPTQLASQSDKLVYGVAFLHPLGSRFRLLGEVHGAHGNPHPGAEDTAVVRLGTQVRAAGFIWDIAGMAGLQKVDPDSGVIFGVSRDFQIFPAPGRAQRGAFRYDPVLFPAARRTQ